MTKVVTCPCQKKSYNSEEFALRVALKRATAGGRPLRAYQCPHGGIWHLTSSVAGEATGVSSNGDRQVTPMERARQLIEHDLKGCLSPEDRRWLFERPLLWLRALQRKVQLLQSQTSRERKALSALKPPSGIHATPEYLQAKYACDERCRRREHVELLVKERIEDVKSLMPSSVYSPDLVNTLVEIATLIDNKEVESARRLAMLFATRLSEGK